MHKQAADSEAHTWAAGERAASRERNYRRFEDEQKGAAEAAARIRERRLEEQRQRERQTREELTKNDATKAEQAKKEKATREAARDSVLSAAARQVEQLRQQRDAMRRAEDRKQKAAEEQERKCREDSQREEEAKRRQAKEANRQRKERTERERARRQEEQVQQEREEKVAADYPMGHSMSSDLSFVNRCEIILSLHERYIKQARQGRVDGRKLLTQLLGVPGNASSATVKKHYRTTMAMFHPDKAPQDCKDIAGRVAQCINDAKTRLLGAGG